MKEENIEIGSRIKNLRLAQKLSREKLAEYSNISTQFLADIETGKKGMTVFTLSKLCKALNVSSDYIIFGSESNIKVSADAMISTLDSEKQKDIIEILQKVIKMANNKQHTGDDK